MPDLKEILLGDDPWSQSFINIMKSLPYHDTLALWKSNPDTKIEDTPYYKYYLDVLTKDGTVWNGILNDEEDVRRQTENFKTMYRIAPNWKPFRKVVSRQVKNYTHYYGPCPIRINNDGNFWLYDGQHRVAILLFMQKPVKLTICERALEWQKLVDDLKEMYGGEKLYQPIPHPDFDSWECGRDNQLDDAVLKIVKDRQVKSVLDLGACHGYTLYKLKELLDSGMAVENNPLRYQVVKLLMSKLGFQSSNLNIKDYIQETPKHYDCILALAVLHHSMRLDSKADFDDLLKGIKAKTKLFLYTLPEPNEQQHRWMYDGIDHHDYIKEVTGFENKRVIPLKSRKLIVLWTNV